MVSNLKLLIFCRFCFALQRVLHRKDKMSGYRNLAFLIEECNNIFKVENTDNELIIDNFVSQGSSQKLVKTKINECLQQTTTFKQIPCELSVSGQGKQVVLSKGLKRKHPILSDNRKTIRKGKPIMIQSSHNKDTQFYGKNINEKKKQEKDCNLSNNDSKICESCFKILDDVSKPCKCQVQNYVVNTPLNRIHFQFADTMKDTNKLLKQLDHGEYTKSGLSEFTCNLTAGNVKNSTDYLSLTQNVAAVTRDKLNDTSNQDIASKLKMQEKDSGLRKCYCALSRMSAIDSKCAYCTARVSHNNVYKPLLSSVEWKDKNKVASIKENLNCINRRQTSQTNRNDTSPVFPSRKYKQKKRKNLQIDTSTCVQTKYQNKLQNNSIDHITQVNGCNTVINKDMNLLNEYILDFYSNSKNLKSLSSSNKVVDENFGLTDEALDYAKNKLISLNTSQKDESFEHVKDLSIERNNCCYTASPCSSPSQSRSPIIGSSSKSLSLKKNCKQNVIGTSTTIWSVKSNSPIVGSGSKSHLLKSFNTSNTVDTASSSYLAVKGMSPIIKSSCKKLNKANISNFKTTKKLTKRRLFPLKSSSGTTANYSQGNISEDKYNNRLCGNNLLIESFPTSYEMKVDQLHRLRPNCSQDMFTDSDSDPESVSNVKQECNQKHSSDSFISLFQSKNTNGRVESKMYPSTKDCQRECMLDDMHSLQTAKFKDSAKPPLMDPSSVSVCESTTDDFLQLQRFVNDDILNLLCSKSHESCTHGFIHNDIKCASYGVSSGNRSSEGVPLAELLTQENCQQNNFTSRKHTDGAKSCAELDNTLNVKIAHTADSVNVRTNKKQRTQSGNVYVHEEVRSLTPSSATSVKQSHNTDDMIMSNNITDASSEVNKTADPAVQLSSHIFQISSSKNVSPVLSIGNASILVSYLLPHFIFIIEVLLCNLPFCFL